MREPSPSTASKRPSRRGLAWTYLAAGRFGEDAVWAAARDSLPKKETENRCEAFYYLGVARLLGLPGSEPGTAKAVE